MPATASVFETSGLKRAGFRGTALLVAAAWLVPFLIHRLPWSGSSPLGAHLLPMFWATFLAVYFYGAAMGVVVGSIAPALNLALTGLPAWRFLSVLSFELVVFSLVVGWAVARAPRAWAIAPLGYLVAKLTSTLIQALAPVFGDIGAPLSFLALSVLTALPGLAVLAALNFLASRSGEQPLDWDRR